MKICRKCENIFDESDLEYNEYEGCYFCPDCDCEELEDYDEDWEAYMDTQRDDPER